jgi:hypothetical protein
MLSVLLAAGCVTQTERVAYYPYASHEDESVLDELRRELGWQKTSRAASGEPFYTRAVRRVKETVSGWFREEPTRMTAEQVEEERYRFEEKRQEALRRLREQQGQQQGLSNED